VSAPRCPKCGRNQTRRTARAGAVERLLTALYVYPFHCQGCGRRFRAMQWGVRYVRHPVEQREFERVAVKVPAIMDDGHARREGQTLNLSLDGCAIEIDAPPPPDTAVRVELHLPHDRRPVLVASAVVRAAREGAAGLHFVRMAADDRERLRRFMSELLGQRGAPAGRWGLALRYGLSLNVWLAGLFVLLVVVVLFALSPRFSICRWGIDC